MKRRVAIALGLLLLCTAWAGAARPGHAGELRVTDFFRDARIHHPQLNAQGDLMLLRETDRGITTIRVVEVEGERSADVYRFASAKPPRYLTTAWAADSTFVITSSGSARLHHFVRVDFSLGGMRLEWSEITLPGTLECVDARIEGVVLWSPLNERSSVYRLSISELTDVAGSARALLADDQLVARLPHRVEQWSCDREGTPRFAVVSEPGRPPEYWYSLDGAEGWEQVRYRPRSREDWSFPIGLGPDGTSLVFGSDVRTGRTGLYRWVPTAADELTPLVEHPERDIVMYQWDWHDQEIVTGAYFEAGRPHYLYVNEPDQRRWARVLEQFPSSSLEPQSRSRDRSVVVLWIGGPADPGRLAVVRDGVEVKDLGPIAPWLPPERMAKARTIEIPVAGVGKVESYLWMPPPRPYKPSLVVYPHGGPIGVMDTATFNPIVQYYASAGYAVLQVNFRGSAGFGTGFERAGWRQWGRGIEDDIDAAVDHLLEGQLVDPYRACIVGESYGGYSALISTVRHRNRYLCAVSTAGVTDIGLFFENKAMGLDRAVRKSLARMLGDPETEYEEMKRHSPVFRVADMRTPILLIHGDEDERVDVEHAYRLQSMLDLYGRDYQFHILEGVGHGDWPKHVLQNHQSLVMRFLKFHLE